MQHNEPAETEKISALEIAPMRDVSDPPRILTIRPARPGETPDLWCVIARMKGGAGRVLKDERDQSAALAFAEAFREQLRGTQTYPLPAIVAI